MKLIKTIILVGILCGCSINSDTDKRTYESHYIDSLRLLIDSIQNTEAFMFQTAINIEETNLDSARNIYSSISQYSVNDFWTKQAKSRLTYLEAEKTKIEFLDKIEGTWKWRSTFTNWSEIESPSTCNCKKKIVITNGKLITFYIDNKVVRETEIEILSKPIWHGGFLTENIYFLDNKELRTIYYNDKTNTLTFSEPDCVCGCLTDEYSRH